VCVCVCVVYDFLCFQDLILDNSSENRAYIQYVTKFSIYIKILL